MADEIEDLLDSIDVDGGWHSVSQERLDAVGIDIRDLAMRIEDRAMSIGVEIDIEYTSVQADTRPYMHMIRATIQYRTHGISSDFWKAMYQ